MFVSAMITKRGLRATIAQKTQEFVMTIWQYLQKMEEKWCGWKPRSEILQKEYMKKLLEDEEGSLRDLSGIQDQIEKAAKKNAHHAKGEKRRFLDKPRKMLKTVRWLRQGAKESWKGECRVNKRGEQGLTIW